ncbi:CBF/Mak21 family protein [Cardiosporidium cionae]|uniref:CBF/Mak21 family protein n=1 Tax=Cardiosporidium cionae TaxID=476202 RepID=A0ABQ7JAG6_9APIC|nr:CBF/Mak21 family protein [Cardiosporidium cionae]|eukprot:KAF8820938.1 CBF/Mak21 family protein [Cardiosporidium cionae]
MLSPATFLSLLSKGDVEICISALRISPSIGKSAAATTSSPAEVAKLLSLTLKALCTTKFKLLLPFHFAEFHGGLSASVSSVSNSSFNGGFGEVVDESSSLKVSDGGMAEPISIVQFRCFLNVLFSLLHSGGCHTESAQLRVCALRLIKRVVKHEALLRQKKNGDFSFPLGFFQVCVSIALQIPRANQEYVDCFCDEYIHASDLRYYSLIVMRKILEDYASRSAHDCSIPKWCNKAGSESEKESVANDAMEKFELPYNGKNYINIFQSGTPWYFWSRSSTELVSTFFSILSAVPSPQKNMKTTDEESVPEEATNSSSQKKRKKIIDGDSALNCFIENLNNSKCCNAYNYRQIFQTVWLLFLRCVPSDSKALESILHYLPKHVLPHLSNPLAFSECFLSLYANCSNPSLNIVALCGVFYLLTKHRLGDPHVLGEGRFSNDSSNLDGNVDAADRNSNDVCHHFFIQLYRLVKPITFSIARRAGFLRLLKTALFSPLLPIHLVSLFIKKCARTACLVPPAAALWLLVFIHTLLRKYKNVCTPLLHVPATLARSIQIELDSFDFEEASLTFSANSDGHVSLNHEITNVSDISRNDRAIEQNQSHNSINLIDCLPDCFRFNQSDVTGSLREQIRLSLWELELLKKHYYPAVAQMAQLFDTDIFKDNAKSVDIEDFLEITYEKLLKNDMKTKRRRTCDTTGTLKAAAIASVPNVEPPAVTRLLSVANLF